MIYATEQIDRILMYWYAIVLHFDSKRNYDAIDRDFQINHHPQRRMTYIYDKGYAIQLLKKFSGDEEAIKLFMIRGRMLNIIGLPDLMESKLLLVNELFKKTVSYLEDIEKSFVTDLIYIRNKCGSFNLSLKEDNGRIKLLDFIMRREVKLETIIIMGSFMEKVFNKDFYSILRTKNKSDVKWQHDLFILEKYGRFFSNIDFGDYFPCINQVFGTYK